jgi:hypothetical protein
MTKPSAAVLMSAGGTALATRPKMKSKKSSWDSGFGGYEMPMTTAASSPATAANMSKSGSAHEIHLKAVRTSK